jgi:hypothetical protein
MMWRLSSLFLSVATFGSEWLRKPSLHFAVEAFMARGAPKAKASGRGRGAAKSSTRSSDVDSALANPDSSSTLVAMAEASRTTTRRRLGRRDSDEQACRQN